MLKDVTNEVFGTKNAPVKAAPIKEAEENKDTAVATAMNPPEATDSSKKVLTVSKETNERCKSIEKLFRDLSKNFVGIGYELFTFRQDKAYKELGYKNFDEFVKCEFHLSRSAAYNFINVCVKFSVRDEKDQPTRVLGKEYSKYSSSQLIAMLSLDKDDLIMIDPDKTIKQIQQLTKKSKGETITYFDPETGEESLEDGTPVDDAKPKKRNVRDITIPVIRLSMGTGRTWDDISSDKIRKACEMYLSDEKRTADGNDYKIEVCIVYPDKTAI